jgi:ligand-binding SRPBCC domain-containing protein
MSKVHTLQTVQLLPVSLEEAWHFFSHPQNLAVITPDSLNLKFTNKLFGEEAYAGQVITYTVKPLLGIPFFWMTEITHMEPMKYFVDEQRRGPYALWHHQHHFREVAGGVEMTDIVHYGLPLYPFGNLALPLVKKKLKEIFDYRYQKIEAHFNRPTLQSR